MTWTDDRVNLARRLYIEGLKASEIAARLNEGLPPDRWISRNAVIGKLARLGISGTRTRVRHARHRPLAANTERKRRAALPAATPASAPVALDRTRECQWPTSDGRPWVFCHQACQAGSSYCPTHRAMSVRETEKPKFLNNGSLQYDPSSARSTKRPRFDRAEAKWGL